MARIEHPKQIFVKTGERETEVVLPDGRARLTTKQRSVLDTKAAMNGWGKFGNLDANRQQQLIDDCFGC